MRTAASTTDHRPPPHHPSGFPAVVITNYVGRSIYWYVFLIFVDKRERYTYVLWFLGIIQLTVPHVGRP